MQSEHVRADTGTPCMHNSWLMCDGGCTLRSAIGHYLSYTPRELLACLKCLAQTSKSGLNWKRLFKVYVLLVSNIPSSRGVMVSSPSCIIDRVGAKCYSSWGSLKHVSGGLNVNVLVKTTHFSVLRHRFAVHAVSGECLVYVCMYSHSLFLFHISQLSVVC